MHLHSEPMNEEDAGIAYQAKQYSVPVDEAGNSTLTGEGSANNNMFTPVEIEVFEVI